MVGFIGEIMVFLGAFQYNRGWRLCLDRMLLTAAYILWTIQRVFFGEQKATTRSSPI